jgi:tetratricopeptide (TPR) repeat protein
MSDDPSNSIAVLLRFHQWEDMLTFPEPAADLKVSFRDIHAIRGFWHFGRGLAFAATSRLQRARAELDALLEETALAPAESPFGTSLDLEHALDKLSQNSDAATLKICAATLRARMAEAAGDLPESVRLLREAASVQDAMPYSEPPAWFYPLRESLGAMLLKGGSAAEAETVFREGLRRSPHDARLLFGLAEALGAQGRAADAAKVHSEFEAAWHESDGKLTVSSL